jgi:hypothetical protein
MAQEKFKKNIIGLVLIAVTAFATSCEYTYPYSYSITNSCDTTIVIHIKTYRIDSIYYLTTNTKRKLYITTHRVEGARGPYSGGSVNNDLSLFIVAKKGVSSKRDFLKNENWSYSNGNYYTTITNAEF